MISDKQYAARVLSETQECFRRLNQVLLDAQDHLSPDEFARLRGGIGRVLGYLYTDVEAPIHHAHPELEPSNLRGGGNNAGNT